MKKVFLTIFDELPKKNPQFKVAKAKCFSPHGSKVAQMAKKLSNLAELDCNHSSLFSSKMSSFCASRPIIPDRKYCH